MKTGSHIKATSQIKIGSHSSRGPEWKFFASPLVVGTPCCSRSRGPPMRAALALQKNSATHRRARRESVCRQVVQLQPVMLPQGATGGVFSARCWRMLGTNQAGKNFIYFTMLTNVIMWTSRASRAAKVVGRIMPLAGRETGVILRPLCRRARMWERATTTSGCVGGEAAHAT